MPVPYRTQCLALPTSSTVTGDLNRIWTGLKICENGLSVVHTNAKTNLKALELFVKFQQKKCQRSNGSQPLQSKPCNPALHASTTREVVRYDASITGATLHQEITHLRTTTSPVHPYKLLCFFKFVSRANNSKSCPPNN